MRAAGCWARAATSARSSRESPLQARHHRQRRAQGPAGGRVTSSRSTARPRSSAAERGRRPRRCCTSRSSTGAVPAPSCTRTRFGARCFQTVTSSAGGLAIEGYEMLKGLEGVDDARASRVDADRRERSGHAAARAPGRRGARPSTPTAHAFLLGRHGLYTWGRDARRGRAARRDSRVSARDDRGRTAGRESGRRRRRTSRMALVRHPRRQSHASATPTPSARFWPRSGIDYERADAAARPSRPTRPPRSCSPPTARRSTN